MQIAFVTVSGSPDIFSLFDNGLIRLTTSVEFTNRALLPGGVDASGNRVTLDKLPVINASASERVRLQSYDNALRDLDLDRED